MIIIYITYILYNIILYTYIIIIYHYIYIIIIYHILYKYVCVCIIDINKDIYIDDVYVHVFVSIKLI